MLVSAENALESCERASYHSSIHQFQSTNLQDGWWKGAVHKKVDKEYYLCYFLSNGLEQLRFHYSELRTPQEWINGKWIVKGSEVSVQSLQVKMWLVSLALEWSICIATLRRADDISGMDQQKKNWKGV